MTARLPGDVNHTQLSREEHAELRRFIARHTQTRAAELLGVSFHTLTKLAAAGGSATRPAVERVQAALFCARDLAAELTQRNGEG